MVSYYDRYNIRKNTIYPGGIVDPMANLSKKQSSRFFTNYIEKVTLKRLGKPDEVASAILFLASSVSSYITGTTKIADG